jgi:hypothetical protein
VPSARVAGPALVLVLVALVALLLAWAVVPSARVHVVPAAEAWSTPLAIEVDPALKQPDAGSGRLPGRSVSKEIVESATAQASGRRVVPDAPATGQVVFINKTDKPVTVPRGTAVMAGPARFLTKGDVTVAASVAAGMQRRVGMGRVDVAAAQGGPSGNVDRYQISRTEGPLAASLDVQNDAPTRGGTEKQVAYVTAEDRRRLQETLQRSLTERLLQQVRGQLPAPDKETAVPWAGQNPQVVEAVFSKNAEEEAPTVSLSLKLRYGVTVFGNEAYNAMVRQMVARRLGEARPGYEVVPESVRPEPPAVVAVDQGIVRLSGQAGATVRPRLDPGNLRGALTNRPAAEAKAYLDNLPGVAAYELQTWPGWLGRLPWLGLRIGISVGPPAPAQSEGAPRRDESTWRSAPNGP